MTKERRNLVGKKILSWLLDQDQELAVKISSDAEKVAKRGGITTEEIRELLDPWVRYVLRHDDSH